ncbi:MAG: hypothetical protein ACREOG_00370 [Gemmatimonadaceae bacterium]
MPSSPPNEVISRRARLALSAAIGVAAGLIAYGLHQRSGFWPDYVFPWQAARLLLEGRDPYQALPGGLAEPFESPLLYPLPTVLAAVPFAWLSLPVASAITMGLSSALLTWVLVGIELDLLWILASAPFVMAINFGQWSPLITVALLTPALGFLTALKPNIGLAVLVARPALGAWVGAAIVGALSMLVLPAWPIEWLRAIRTLPGHPSPILSGDGAGLLLAAAALKWRTREGRLLLVLACVPQLLFFADQLPLMLVARTKRERRFLVGTSLLAFLGWFVSLSPGEWYVPAAAPFVLWLVYIPALVIVLLRPNETKVSSVNAASGASNSA